MSGVCGIIHFDGSPVDHAVLRKLVSAAPHRGPDGIAEYFAAGAGFAHLALHSTPESIRECQPLVRADGQLVLVADARIDNRQDLIVELRSDLPEGIPTDADLILAAYVRWREQCAIRLLGDFAFAIWDADRRRLFCARDAIGMRSICYARAGDAVVFASEVGQVLAHPGVSREIDRAAVGVRVAGYTEDPSRTLFTAIRRVRPGSSLIAEAAGERHERYWEPPIEDGSPDRDDDGWADELRALLSRAVDDRLRSPTMTVAMELSGGLDSSSVAATAARSRTASLVGVTWRFDQLRSCDESPYSAAIAEAGGFPLHSVAAESRWFLHDPHAFRPSADSPYIGWPTIVTEACEVARRAGARVLLTGRGGDELFRGDPAVLGEELWRHRAGVLHVLRQLRRLAHERNVAPWRALYGWVLRPGVPEPLASRLRVALRNSPSFPKWALPDPHVRAEVRDRINAASAPVRSRRMTQQNRYKGIRDLGFTYDLFGHYDRIPAPFGIEVRHPLFDRRLVEFALRLPPRCLMREGTSKWVLRRAFRGILPENVRCRPRKTSFAPFTALALRDRERTRVSDLFRDPLLARLGLVDRPGLTAAFAEYCEGTASISAALLQCILSEIWLREHSRN